LVQDLNHGDFLAYVEHLSFPAFAAWQHDFYDFVVSNAAYIGHENQRTSDLGYCFVFLHKHHLIS